ncbi:MAG: hypothetical protein ACTSQ7_10105 [Alphaproteobacteria bacterium]
MTWWLVIAAVVVAALAYGYWDHTKQSRHLAKLFAALAAKYRGQVKRASLLALPQLRFERDGRAVLVGALATSGQVSAGSSGYSGPFSFVDLELPFDSGQKLRAEPATGIEHHAGRLIDAVVPDLYPKTGHGAFDDAFRIAGDDPAFATRLFGPEVRERLLASRLQRLQVRIAGRKVGVHIDGIVGSQDDLEEMIEIAVSLAENCSPVS